MSYPGHGQGSTNTPLAPPPVKAQGSYVRASAKRPREDSDPESDFETKDNHIADMEQMDSRHAMNITATQALGEETQLPGYVAPELPPPLNAEHAALRADIEIITQAAMERHYSHVAEDIMKAAADTATAFKKSTDQLHSQINSLGSRVTQLQQQLLTYQHPVQVPTTTPAAPVAVPAKKVLKLKLAKKNAGADVAGGSTTATTDTIPQVPSTDPPTPAVNSRGWETVQTGAKKTKAPIPKLITTKYPQAEREVTCHFRNGGNNSATGIQPEKSYSERQTIADTALQKVNSALVDNKDVFAPPFIRAQVTIRGSIIFTTSNTQNNVVYEEYTTIIADALSYNGECERVEIGKRFSQFLLHGVPTHLSMSEISDSIATNYPQLVQGQTPRWLTTAERREHKTNSTILMTLTGDIKKASIGRQNLIVCNRECQLDDYIAYRRSTQCHNCQTYGHPAAL